MRRPLLLALVAALAALAAGFATGLATGRASSPRGLVTSLPAKRPALATFRGGTVSREDVLAAIEKQPAALRDRLRTPEARAELVGRMVRIELLALEAERVGLDRDPEFLPRYKDELGRVLVERQLADSVRRAAPTDAELRAFYDEHRAALARPGRARIAIVQYSAPEGDEAARAAQRAKADAALARLRAARDPRAFTRLAVAESEDLRSRLANGELPFLTREEIAARLGPEVAGAAFEIGRPGDLAPAVVEGPRGFHLVKLLGREEGYQPSFEELRSAIRDRLAAERRRAAHDAFLEALWERAAVRLDEEAIGALGVDGSRGEASGDPASRPERQSR